ncbi:MAG: hypothetical protein A3F84_08185 [Candidatus Handelsmanbacteria bacterium RIFCSPLOWO2_12_FULL_64_10]|uniref:Uncharacterized protein n=1 Tax=Handelsmanbacteria sp. (strain RIFCSPLOWO2_12_FULL_64_10) TaxID=1817868 RepID=A0A1F6C498_HANXR|nr:MAG: hypothetical protein A3F84_08185 [Candidatus Handelsmanbacteria bacterium RIFCSPLOWO2_12_FULL_64_10]
MSHHSRVFLTIFCTLILIPLAFAGAADLSPEIQTLLNSPDITYSGVYDFACRPAVLDSLLRHPILLGRLWAAYGFAPAYRVRPQGDGLHVEDPTGIVGEVRLAQQAGNRWVYLGEGRLNHRLVPAFGGKMALVITTTPKGAGVSARVGVFLRTESRTLGLLTWTLSPLVRGRIENRATFNARDLGVILKEVSDAPQQTASRLPEEDAKALTRLLNSTRGTGRAGPGGP